MKERVLLAVVHGFAQQRQRLPGHQVRLTHVSASAAASASRQAGRQLCTSRRLESALLALGARTHREVEGQGVAAHVPVIHEVADG